MRFRSSRQTISSHGRNSYPLAYLHKLEQHGATSFSEYRVSFRIFVRCKSLVRPVLYSQYHSSSQNSSIARPTSSPSHSCNFVFPRGSRARVATSEMECVISLSTFVSCSESGRAGAVDVQCGSKMLRADIRGTGK